ncbi:hypothetical protein GCM10020220_036480 [Nonomuraea rubra]
MVLRSRRRDEDAGDVAVGLDPAQLVVVAVEPKPAPAAVGGVQAADRPVVALDHDAVVVAPGDPGEGAAAVRLDRDRLGGGAAPASSVSGPVKLPPRLTATVSPRLELGGGELLQALPRRGGAGAGCGVVSGAGVHVVSGARTGGAGLSEGRRRIAGRSEASTATDSNLIRAHHYLVGTGESAEATVA